jgi:hypothetical protein
MKKLLLCGALMGAIGLTSEARADSVKIGTLSCNEAGGWGLIFGASHAIRCTYAGNGRVEHYDGSISKYGVDIGYQQSGVLVWTVFAPTNDPGPGALAGHYGGLTAGATVGVGLAANALVGGSNNTIALQPLSIEGTTGLNVAAGVGDLSLHFHPRD